MKRAQLAGMASLLALLLAAGCGSILGGDNGSNNPYPSQPSSNPTAQNSAMQGVVNNIDTRAQRIDLTVDAVNGRSNNPYQSSIYYDSRTRVVYNGQQYTPSNLERGDRIDVSMYYTNGQSVADTITVVQDARSQSSYPAGGAPYTSGTYPPPNTSGSTYPNQNESIVSGTVNYVDTTAQRIDLTSAYMTNLRNSGSSSGNYSIYYSANTPVYWQNQTFRPSDLERGDQVQVRLLNNSSSQFQADTITVTRNVRQ